jgi:YceI-like domain
MKNKKNVVYGLIIMLAEVACVPVLAQQKNGAQDVICKLDVKKSKLFWNAPRNRHNGFILFNSGSLNNFTAGGPTRGTFSINMNSIRSTDEASAAGRKKVDDKLRSEEFFAVSKYPTASIMVNKIIPQLDRTSFKVYGQLTIKGVTNPIEFATIIKLNGSTITATASITIDRKKWNIDHQPEQSWDIFNRVQDNLVDDEIAVRLELVFTQK